VWIFRGRWSAGPLVRWSAGPLVRWSAGPLVSGPQRRKALRVLRTGFSDQRPSGLARQKTVRFRDGLVPLRDRLGHHRVSAACSIARA
jgi:hypothetical protein